MSRQLFWLVLLASTVNTVLTEGEYGNCLYNITIPEGGHVRCDPANSLPQICTISCKPGYYAVGIQQEMTCMNSLCQNQCAAVQKTCVGSVPVKRVDVNGVSYTDYIREERPCCTLEKLEAPWCDLGACTGTCQNPGIYTFDAKSCPDVCVPYREPEVPTWNCAPCQPPSIPAYMQVIPEGSPPNKMTVQCPKGQWGTPEELLCGPDGTWTPWTSKSCNECSEHNYPLETLNADMFDIQVTPGKVQIFCKKGFRAPETQSMTFSCDTTTGEWSYWDEVYCIPDRAVDEPITEDVAAATTNPCTSHPYALDALSDLDAVVYPGQVDFHCKEEFEERVWTYICDQEWPVLETMECSTIPSITHSTTPSQTPASTPSASKSPRPPKVKGSRAPTQAPKIRGSLLPRGA
jgi:hypothetical protein